MKELVLLRGGEMVNPIRRFKSNCQEDNSVGGKKDDIIKSGNSPV